MNSVIFKSIFILSLFFSLSSNAIKVTRTVFPVEAKPGDEVVVTFEVQKEGESGFAKILETIPSNFIAKELNSNSGRFLCDGNKVKIIWLEIPLGDKFTCSYKLIYNGTEGGRFNLKGKLFYLKDEERQTSVISATPLKIWKLKEKELTTTEVITPVAKPKLEEVKTEVTETVAAEVEAVDEPEVKAEVEPVVEPVVEAVTSSQLIYKVQLGVFSTEKSEAVFKGLPEIHYDRVKKLYKYYSGKFTSESEARENISKAKAAGFTGAFMVKFKDGKRI